MLTNKKRNNTRTFNDFTIRGRLTAVFAYFDENTAFRYFYYVFFAIQPKKNSEKFKLTEQYITCLSQISQKLNILRPILPISLELKHYIRQTQFDVFIFYLKI